jgi:hypothetical protein
LFEHVSSSDVAATDALYCSVFSLTRIKHVVTGEYVVAADKIIGGSGGKDETILTESSMHSGGGGDQSSTQGSEGGGGEDGFNEITDDNDTMATGGEDDGGVDNEDMDVGAHGSRKEKPMGTVAIVPDESVFQMSAVSPADVDHCFIVQGLSSHIVAFIDYTSKVLKAASAIESSGTKPPATVTANNHVLVKPAQDALTGLVAFVCNIKLTKSSEAMNVTNAPLKIQQHVMIE